MLQQWLGLVSITNCPCLHVPFHIVSKQQVHSLDVSWHKKVSLESNLILQKINKKDQEIQDLVPKFFWSNRFSQEILNDRL